MKPLDRKLLRDMLAMKGQAVAIALVIACGVATFVMSLSTLDSLKATQAAYYRDYRFADVFATLKRAPEGLKERLDAIPGVELVETRVVAPVSMDIEAYPDPISGRVISVPDEPGEKEPLLNNLYLTRGRSVEPGRDDEVVIGDPFAVAHRLSPGDKLTVTINGRKKKLTIVGIALSPEHIIQIRPGTLIPDFERYGILWMGRTSLGAAFDMEGAFNDVTLRLSRGAEPRGVIDRLDDILTPYGGFGAYSRKDQLSHRYLSEEFRQLTQMATIFPLIFLGVSAFLLNVVVGRLVNTQREQVAILKAFGYANSTVAIHYLKLVMAITAVGAGLGLGMGVWLGKNLSAMYMDFYRFPFLLFMVKPGVVVYGVVISAVSAATGTLFAIRRASRLPPAEAMRPEPPARYRETLIEKAGFKKFLSQPARMIIRHIGRRPVKSGLTIIGIASSCAIMMSGTFFGDSIDYMVEVQFGLANREDLSVVFVEPASRGALFELKSLEGVEYVEPYRAVPAKLKFGHREYRAAIQGFVERPSLHRALDTNLNPIVMPRGGVLLTDQLGKILGARVGDVITVETLEGARPVRRVPIAGFVGEFVGVSAYMELGALNRLMREGDAISGAYIKTDRAHEDDISERLKDMPRVASATKLKDLVRNVYDTMGEQIRIFTLYIVALSAVIAFGVVYNSARIALAERERELASLRVLGFTRGEISFILLGELGALTLMAIPLGFVIGWGVCAGLIYRLQTDLFRIPLVLEPSTFALAAVVVLLSACVSGYIVKARLDGLDLVSALKTKE